MRSSSRGTPSWVGLGDVVSILAGANGASRPTPRHTPALLGLEPHLPTTPTRMGTGTAFGVIPGPSWGGGTRSRTSSPTLWTMRPPACDSANRWTRRPRRGPRRERSTKRAVATGSSYRSAGHSPRYQRAWQPDGSRGFGQGNLRGRARRGSTEGASAAPGDGRGIRTKPDRA